MNVRKYIYLYIYTQTNTHTIKNVLNDHRTDGRGRSCRAKIVHRADESTAAAKLKFYAAKRKPDESQTAKRE